MKCFDLLLSLILSLFFCYIYIYVPWLFDELVICEPLFKSCKFILFFNLGINSFEM